MPNYQAMVETINVKFNRQNIASVPADPFDPASQLDFGQSAMLLGVAKTNDEMGFLNALPASVKDGLKAALNSARTSQLPLQMVWVPGFDYELNVWEAPGTPTSIGGISVVLKTPYKKPGD